MIAWSPNGEVLSSTLHFLPLTVCIATILTCGHYAGACSCPEEEDCEMSSPRGWPLEVAKPLDNSHCRVRLLPGINPFQKIWSRLTSRTRLKIGGQPIKRELILPERITITDFIKPKAAPPFPSAPPAAAGNGAATPPPRTWIYGQR